MARSKPKSKAKAKVKAKAKPKVKAKAKPKAPVKKAKAAAVKLTKALKKAAVIQSDLSDFITPLDDRILVEVEVLTKTAGGLFIPSTATDRPQQGKVIAVGRGHRDKKGRLRPMDVSLGDVVMFTQYGGVNMTLKDKEVLILRESDILGILER